MNKNKYFFASTTFRNHTHLYTGDIIPGFSIMFNKKRLGPKTSYKVGAHNSPLISGWEKSETHLFAAMHMDCNSIYKGYNL